MIGAISSGQPAAAKSASQRPAPAELPSRSTTAERSSAVAPQAQQSDQLEAQRVRELITDPNNRVSTHRDDGSGRVVMTVVERETGELVDQIPSETLLKLYESLREPLVDEQA